MQKKVGFGWLSNKWFLPRSFYGKGGFLKVREESMQTTNKQFARSTGYVIHITYTSGEAIAGAKATHLRAFLMVCSKAVYMNWVKRFNICHNPHLPPPRLFQVFAGEGGRKGAQLALVIFMSRPSVFANAVPGVLLSIVNYRSGLFCQCQWHLLPAKQKAVKRLLQECHCDKHCIFTGLKSSLSSYCTMPMQHSSSLLERTS